jgi:hypothetical protein
MGRERKKEAVFSNLEAAATPGNVLRAASRARRRRTKVAEAAVHELDRPRAVGHSHVPCCERVVIICPAHLSWNRRAVRADIARTCTERLFFNLRYDHPEPVLIKRSCLVSNGVKTIFSHQTAPPQTLNPCPAATTWRARR